MLAKVFSAITVGLEAVKIEVEVDVAQRGFPTFTIVGLPNKAVDEAKDRVRTAITNSGFIMPDSRITVNLAPADIPKNGSSFDLPIAIGILAASQIVSLNTLTDKIFVGELSLEGKIRKVPGVLSVALLAKQCHYTQLFIPSDNKSEVGAIDSPCVYAGISLSEVVAHLQDKISLKNVNIPQNLISTYTQSNFESDFADIKGQEQAKRALEIAAAGFHNIHLKGSPGAGKTMLARAFPSILPELKEAEIFEVSQIYSICGLLDNFGIMKKRPFRSPHHTISRIGLVGGGTQPAPGEISLAHRGVLFMDEFTEFPQGVLEALRQPLEDGKVTISRAAGRVTFPARFLLFAASNPCPCGYFGHPKKKCTCPQQLVSMYGRKLSGPLLDRIDLHLTVLPVEETKLFDTKKAEKSEAIYARVMSAVDRQKARFRSTALNFNSDMGTKEIKKFCKIDPAAQTFLQKAVVKLSLSARAYTRTIKVAQTIADLDCQDNIKITHMAEALQYRSNTV